MQCIVLRADYAMQTERVEALSQDRDKTETFGIGLYTCMNSMMLTRPREVTRPRQGPCPECIRS